MSPTKMQHQPSTVTIVGDGGWGTTLALHLYRQGLPVVVWSAFPGHVQTVKETGYNEKFLPGIRIPRAIEFTHDLGGAIHSGNLVVLAVPSQYVGGVLKDIKACQRHPLSILSVIKGIDTDRLLRMSQIISAALLPKNLAVLSGPTIAHEVACEIPSTAVIAAKNLSYAKRLQKIFHSSTFRIYTNSDVVGVEMGGSLKNVIAVACGVCDGLGFGTNTTAAIMTRGLVEMARLGTAMGARKRTFSGLTGLGDLVTTCSSRKSRNRFVGEELGKGRNIKDILNGMAMVAEGVPTVKAVRRLAQRYDIAMPICEQVYQIIYKQKDPRTAVVELMMRKLKAE